FKRESEEVTEVHPEPPAMHHDRHRLSIVAMDDAAQGSLGSLVKSRAVFGASRSPIRIVPMLLPSDRVCHEVGQTLPFPSPVAALAQIAISHGLKIVTRSDRLRGVIAACKIAAIDSAERLRA
ncbi:MAG: hypothetical protein OXM03_05500, partial [Chloroflexota bacterium]|nr:hypothetical protein [Chloroflexota bacterium]